jgi:two-component system, response regulator
MNDQPELEILLIEDSPQDIELTLHALRKGNLANKISVARDGEEALDLLFCRGKYSERSFTQPPRVILLDIKLPKVDGLEVLRQIKADPRTRSIPVVVMTSSSEQRDMVAGYQLGLNSFIQKPVDFQEFREIITRLGFYWLVINKAPPREAFTGRS